MLVTSFIGPTFGNALLLMDIVVIGRVKLPSLCIDGIWCQRMFCRNFAELLSSSTALCALLFQLDPNITRGWCCCTLDDIMPRRPEPSNLGTQPKLGPPYLTAITSQTCLYQAALRSAYSDNDFSAYDFDHT